MTDEPAIIEGELDEPTKAVEAYRPAVPAHPLDTDPAAFRQQLEVRSQNYRHLVAWLVDNLEPSDISQVHVTKRSACEHNGPPYCTPDRLPYHWSDPDLSRSGVEKVCGLIGLGARFVGMQDFRHKALQNEPISLVVIDCELYMTADGPAVSQGTGACSVEEIHDGNVNTALKRACKRAQADALKRCAGLSGLQAELIARFGTKDGQKGAKPKKASERPQQTSRRWDTGAELTHCPIGKAWKNRPWTELETKDLEWIVANVQDKPDIHRAAARELSKRQDAAGGSIRTESPPTSDEGPPIPPPEAYDHDPI